jgi:hypothetical protein
MKMHQKSTASRLFKAFLLAVAIAIVLGGIASAQGKPKPSTTQDDGEIIICQPSICMVLEPGGWWWKWWRCDTLPPCDGAANLTATKGVKR